MLQTMSAYTRFSKIFYRLLSSKNCRETQMHELLKKRFPESDINIVDISGGCGALFEVFVESKEFQGLTILKQHKLITETLKDHIKDMHGVRINTAVKKI